MLGYCFDFLTLVTRRTFPISSIRIKKFCATTTVNADKAHKEFQPKFKISEGVERMIAHDFKDNIEK